jgi:hypothetical protein
LGEDVRKRLSQLPTFDFEVCLGNLIEILTAIIDSETQRHKAYPREFLFAAARLKPLHSPILFKKILVLLNKSCDKLFLRLPPATKRHHDTEANCNSEKYA